MIHDLASFRVTDIQSVWGQWPRSPLTGDHRNIDKAHILGRGNKSDRKLHSSILNFVPLDRAIHAGAYRDHPYMRALFLEIAREKVAEAVRNGDYQYTQLDHEFLTQVSREWEQKNVGYLTPPAVV